MSVSTRPSADSQGWDPQRRSIPFAVVEDSRDTHEGGVGRMSEFRCRTRVICPALKEFIFPGAERVLPRKLRPSKSK